MTAGLETFAKVRRLHERTEFPGEKAAAAARMEALARAAGLTVDEALSRLDSAAPLSEADIDWADLWDAIRRSEAASEAAEGPHARSRRHGLPIYDPDKIEPWRNVATHCLALNWTVPKACGGKFLTKDERARLRAIEQYSPVTNADADWIETVLARCHAARDAWCDPNRKGPLPPTREAAESPIEFAARLVAAAKTREAAEPAARPPSPPNPFEELFNSPEYRARRAEREQKDAATRAEALAEHGTEAAVFADTLMEAALRAACEPLRDPGTTWSDLYKLAGWYWLDGFDRMPDALRTAVSEAWPMPETVAAAWAEHQAVSRLNGQRFAFDPDHSPHGFAEARADVIENLLDTLPARSLVDVRARMSRLDEINDLGSPCQDQQRVRLATLRADIERMGARLREQNEAAVQNGHHPDLDDGLKSQPVSPVQSGQREGSAPIADPYRRTNADKRRDVLALLGQGLTDREIARRAGVSPTTVGTIRRTRT